uniref:FBA_2 domain-containing protein n=1 Tax=Caenorhabditis tropicalis TaxID=1561998 RepID=A0A1I7TD60_9PELO
MPQQKLYPQQFGITKCVSMSISRPREIPIEELKYVLEKVEISDSLRINFHNPARFECGFTRFRVDNLEIKEAFWITNETFLAMDCKRIELSRNGKLPIQEFVTQWLSSRNNRFEYFRISSSGADWTGINGNQWDPTVRGRYYRMGIRKIDCSEGIDIVREDGLVATVIKAFGRNYFLVWHRRFQPECDLYQFDT